MDPDVRSSSYLSYPSCLIMPDEILISLCSNTPARCTSPHIWPSTPIPPPLLRHSFHLAVLQTLHTHFIEHQILHLIILMRVTTHQYTPSRLQLNFLSSLHALHSPELHNTHRFGTPPHITASSSFLVVSRD